MSLLDIIGWLGTVCIVLAYLLLVSKKINASSKKYLFLNIIGSVLLGTSLIDKTAWSGVALQSIWIIISLYGLFVNYKEKN